MYLQTGVDFLFFLFFGSIICPFRHQQISRSSVLTESKFRIAIMDLEDIYQTDLITSVPGDTDGEINLTTIWLFSLGLSLKPRNPYAQKGKFSFCKYKFLKLNLFKI